MKYVKLLIDDSKFYDIVDSNAEDLYTLANFLRQSITGYGSYLFYNSWLMHEKGSICGDIYELTEFGEKVLLHEQEFLSGKEKPDEDDPLVFVSSREQLKKILFRWGELMTQEPEPQEILITQDEHGEVKLEVIDE